MGGAPAIPIIPGRDVDGFRKELNPSYGLLASCPLDRAMLGVRAPADQGFLIRPPLVRQDDIGRSTLDSCFDAFS
jgi:hypothetical protein